MSRYKPIDISNDPKPHYPKEHNLKRASQATLLAGPWVGEFGWELFGWHAHLRRLSEYYKETVVGCRAGMEYLYRDFADKIIPYCIESPGTGGWKNAGLDTIPNIRNDYTFEECEFINPYFKIGYVLGRPSRSSRAFFNQKFKRLGEEDYSLAVDIVVHARATNKNDSAKRNIWDEQDWDNFLDRMSYDGYSIAFVGSEDGALSTSQGEDYRGVDLQTTCNVISSGGCMVGPSSGPMHLAALCGTPHVVFSADPNNEARYNEYWNPFNTPVTYIKMERWDEQIKRHGSKSVNSMIS